MYRTKYLSQAVLGALKGLKPGPGFLLAFTGRLHPHAACSDCAGTTGQPRAARAPSPGHTPGETEGQGEQTGGSLRVVEGPALSGPGVQLLLTLTDVLHPQGDDKGKWTCRHLHVRNIQQVLSAPRLVQQESLQGEGGSWDKEIRAPHRLWTHTHTKLF